MTVYLVVSAEESESAIDAIVSRITSPCELRVLAADSLSTANVIDLSPHSIVICYLGDANLAVLIQLAMSCDWKLHVLAHSGAPHSKRGLCIDQKISNQPINVSDLKANEIDLLMCNGKSVINKVVIGRVFSFQPGGHSTHIFERVKTAWRQFLHLKDYQPQRFSLTTANESVVETAAVGIVTMAHAHQSSLGKQLLPDNDSNDGLFYNLIVAPKSISEMLRYVITEPFNNVVSQPGFIGIMRSKSLTISSNEEFEYRHDEKTNQATELVFELKEKAITLLLDPESPLSKVSTSHKETRKISQLPQGNEALLALAKKRLPLITHAATEEFKELYQQLREGATVTPAFLTLMVLSTLLASFGLYANSAPVIIGAMILAPLMSPIVSLSMAFARQDEKLLLPSIRTLLIGLLLALSFAMTLSFLLPLEVITPEIAARLKPTLLDLGIAVVSGVAGAFAYARASAAKSLAGVAIAVALVPPLAVTGIGLGWMSWSVASGAFLLFITNLAGIVFAAAVTFLFLGFSPFSRARKGLVIALSAVLVVSVPLALSFGQLSRQAHVQIALEGTIIDDITLQEVMVLSTVEPMVIHINLLSSEPLTKKRILELKNQIEDKLDTGVILEIQNIIRY